MSRMVSTPWKAGHGLFDNYKLCIKKERIVYTIAARQMYIAYVQINVYFKTNNSTSYGLLQR
ncbi:hypothetical protein EB052_00645 [bacterium]|nr:hypothetical protein [bacterium]